MSALLPLPAALDWLVTSLIASSLLIGLVLLIRHPVARWFGPGAAYALWLLPVARLFLPPLPFAAATWIAPTEAPVAETMIIVDGAIAAAAPVTAQPAAIDILAMLPALLITIWVIGAIIQLARLAQHGARWRQIARASVPVARMGRITVAHSDAIHGPLAIGLLRPFILLPATDQLAFDAQEADLAIDHELSHHRRGDLWANALFAVAAALLWFHPLLRRAIRAFRFDQEAACDATMLAQQPQARAAYARALAKAATGQPHHFATSSLTSPSLASASLASPMVGSDRITERLLMLAQPTPSIARRRIGIALALALLTGASLLTASPARLSAQDAPPAPPAPTEAPAPPAPPAPPEPPALPAIDMDAGPGDHVVRIERDGTTIVLRTNHALAPGEVERMVAEAMASRAEADRAVADGARRAADSQRRTQTVIIRRHADAAHAEASAAASDAAEAAATAAAEAAIAAQPNGSRQHIIIRTRGDGPAGRMVMTPASCGGGRALVDVDESTATGNSRSQVRILNCATGTVTPSVQLAALRAARTQLASADSRMVADLGDARLQALASLEAQIAELERQPR